MALKLPDSAVPMGDFPVAKAIDIDFDDGENLQEKLDNGELGGGGSSSEKQIKDWVSGSSYLEGDYIYHEGKIYRCLTSNSDVDFDEANWKQLTYGIDELENITRLTDFDEAIPEKGKNKIYYVNKLIDAYECAQWCVESMYYDVSGIKQYRGVQRATSINGVDNIMLMREYYLDDNNVMRWGAWKELATMDKVNHGYVKILKNADTDTNEAMFISYKNRDSFGLRIYKNDNSEHELKFNTSGIYYVKNGVKVCGTSVGDVPNTVIVSENTNVSLNSDCVYTVVNGVCYVSLWGFICASAGTHVVNTSMPSTRLTMEGSCTYDVNGYAGGCAYILYDGNGNNKLYVKALATQPLYGSFSYPVAE